MPHLSNANTPFQALNLVGKTISDVQLKRLIHRSERFQLYYGIQNTIERPVFFKLWPPIRSMADLQHHRGIHEARALSSLRHPNIITLYDSGLYKNSYPFLVSEYMSVGSLRSILTKHGPLPLTRALGIIQQIASALEEIHHHAMLHRNLSASCILFEHLLGSNQELVKLSGMEMSKLGADNDQYDSVLPEMSQRNPQYMAPEQILGGTISEAIDLYACGVLLFEMLTGRIPYAHTKPPQIWDDIINFTPPPIGQIVPKLSDAEDLQNLLSCLLAKRPDARLDNARNLRIFTTELLDGLHEDTEQPWTQELEAFSAINTSLHRKPSFPPPRNLPDPDDRPSTKVGVPTVKKTSTPQGSPLEHLDRPVPSVSRRRLQASLFVGPDAHKKIPRGRSGNLNHIFWIGAVPKRLDAAVGLPNLIVATRAHQQHSIDISAKLTGGAPILLHARLSANFVLFNILLPGDIEAWITYQHTLAARQQFTIAFTLNQTFAGRDVPPSETLTRSTIHAANANHPGLLLSSPNTISSLTLDEHFKSLDDEARDSYSSLRVYDSNRHNQTSDLS